jgi:DNA-binding transcriptional MerR regulator
MDSQKLLRIGDFAKLAGTNLRTLRYYDEVGLFQPIERSQGGFRYYRETDIHRLNLIRSLQELGLSLEAIRELMDTRSAALSRHEFVRRIERALAAQDDLLEDRVRSIEAQRVRIREARGKLDQCRPCGQTPHADNNFCEPCPVTGLPLPEQLSALF